jgi:enoyl-CoA hydratase
MSAEVLGRLENGIMTITMNRPEQGNAMSDLNAGELAALMEQPGDEARVIVLEGAGEEFCTGRAAMGQKPKGPQEALAMRRARDVIFHCYAAFRRTPLPVIAVVQGKALGFGGALASLADITLASDKATFQMPELGHKIMPTMAMSALLGKVSQKEMMYIAYSMATLDAKRANQLGIVSEVVPHGELAARRDALCAGLLKAPQIAVLAVKEFAQAAAAMNIEGATEYARNLHATINTSSEMG